MTHNECVAGGVGPGQWALREAFTAEEGLMTAGAATWGSRLLPPRTAVSSRSHRDFLTRTAGQCSSHIRSSHQ